MSNERPPYPSSDPSIVEKLGATKPVGRAANARAQEAIEADKALDAAEEALNELKKPGLKRVPDDLTRYMDRIESDPPPKEALPTTHPERPTDARGIIPRRTNR